MPRSRYRALVGGDKRLLGWDQNSSLLADIADDIVVLIFGLSGKKASAENLTRRPKVRSQDVDNHRPRTIADFNVAWFMGQL